MRIDKVALWLTSPETGFALPPEQINLRMVHTIVLSRQNIGAQRRRYVTR